jgi:hypothetical protein
LGLLNLEKSSREELFAIREKLSVVQREKTALVCQSIKFSTKIMNKILTAIEKVTDVSNGQGILHSSQPADLLMKIKIFLKITRLITEQVNVEVSQSQGPENQFFSMIKIFTEKIQSKLYNLSNDLIKRLLSNTKRRVSEDFSGNSQADTVAEGDYVII